MSKKQKRVLSNTVGQRSHSKSRNSALVHQKRQVPSEPQHQRQNKTQVNLESSKEKDVRRRSAYHSLPVRRDAARDAARDAREACYNSAEKTDQRRLRLSRTASRRPRDGVSYWNIGCQNFGDTGTCSETTSPVGCLFRWKCVVGTAGTRDPWSQGLPPSGRHGTGVGDRQATDYRASGRTGCSRATDCCSAPPRTGDFL